MARWYSIGALRILPCPRQKKNLSLILFQAQNFPSILFYLQEYLYYILHIYFKDYIEYSVICPNSNKVKDDFFHQSNSGVTVETKS